MSEETCDTDDLVELVAKGDSQAWQDLLQRQRGRLLKMVSYRMDRRVRSRFDPSDVVQEALITADRRLPEYLRERGVAFYPWIRKIAWEHLLKLHEKHVEFRIRSIHREVGQLPLTDESAHRLVDRLAGTLTPPSGGIMREEVRWRVRNAMESLKPHEREVLELLYLEQMKSSEIAAVLGISPTTARTRHFRAIEHLSRLLRESE